MTLPSKELLSEVFGITVTTEILIQNAYDEMNGIEFEWKEILFNYMSFHLDFVARKCKEWALIKSNLVLISVVTEEGASCQIDNIAPSVIEDDINQNSIVYSIVFDSIIFEADTELEVIFKVCNWIKQHL